MPSESLICSNEVFVHRSDPILPQIYLPAEAPVLPLHPNLFGICSGSVSDTRLFRGALSLRPQSPPLQSLLPRRLRSGAAEAGTPQTAALTEKPP